MVKRSALWQRFLPISLILFAFVAFLYFRLYRFLSFSTLKAHHDSLLVWTHQHYTLAVIIYISIYTLVVAASVPGAVFLTVAGGFLFGLFLGTGYTVIAATLGATLLFWAVKTASGNGWNKRANTWLGKLKQGFQKNAFSYLLALRLIPVCPFWAVNIIAALLNMRLDLFVLATFIGIIPGAIVYTALGYGLEQVFANNRTPDLGIIFRPYIILPLLALALLSLLPILYRKLKLKTK